MIVTRLQFFGVASVLIAVTHMLATMPVATAMDASSVPKEKQTKLGLYMTPVEAYEKWRGDSDNVKILDVRTPEEYIFVGHAEMAWNIPFTLQTYQWDPEKKHFAMRPNANFVEEVQSWAHPDDTILVMCRSGGRSARAVNALADAGFKNVYSIVDGMEGDLVQDPASADHGKRTLNGWKNSGLPWTYSLDPEHMRLAAQK